VGAAAVAAGFSCAGKLAVKPASDSTSTRQQASL
jgi:hypothetical protein